MSCTLLIPLCLPAIQLLVVGIRVACDGIQQASMILATANSAAVWTGTGSLCNYQPTPRNRLISTLESRLGCTTKVHKLFLTTPKTLWLLVFQGLPTELCGFAKSRFNCCAWHKPWGQLGVGESLTRVLQPNTQHIARDIPKQNLRPKCPTQVQQMTTE